MPPSSKLRQISILFLLALVLVLLVRLNSHFIPHNPTTIAPTSSFELEILGADSYSAAEFNLEYAFAHGFHQIDFLGNRYTQKFPGIIFKSPADELSPTLYKVIVDQRHLPLLSPGINSLFSPGTLRLIDNLSSHELAAYRMPRDGWPGDKAGAWLARLLHPTAFYNTGQQQTDITKETKIEQVAPTSILLAEDIEKSASLIAGCSSTISFGIDHAHREIRTPNWILLVPLSFKQVVCLEKGLLVFTSWRQEEIGFVWIDSSGSVFARGALQNDKINLRNVYHHMQIVSAHDDGQNLTIHQAYFLLPSPFIIPITAAHELVYTIPLSAITL